MRFFNAEGHSHGALGDADLADEPVGVGNQAQVRRQRLRMLSSL